jgi:3-hydroxyisobutyrate dehydrogenase
VSADSDSVAVIGLGNLGGAIAKRLIKLGWSVSVADTERARVEELAAAGAVPSLDLTAVKFLCFVTPDDTAITRTLEDGLLRDLRPDHVVVVHSTILPNAAQRLAELVGRSGAGFVEAPVSGGAERAQSGNLAVFVGGEPEDIQQADELLHAIGSQIFVMGPTGAASATKLANQLVLFASTAGLHEALDLTASFGVDDNAVLEALRSGLGDTWSGRNWGFFDQLASDYDAAGVPREVRPWSKDPREFKAAAEAAGTSAPVAGLLTEILPALIENHAQAPSGREGQA